MDAFLAHIENHRDHQQMIEQIAMLNPWFAFWVQVWDQTLEIMLRSSLEYLENPGLMLPSDDV